MASTEPRVLLALAALALFGGCRPKKPPIAKRAWLGPSGGCVSTPMHETSGTFACWGGNDAGQIGDGTTSARPFARRMTYAVGEPTDLALGERHGCGIFDKRVYCWGDGALGQLGGTPPVARSLTPVPVSTPEEEKSPSLAAGVGLAHTCIATRDRLRCFGDGSAGQLGPFADGTVRSFALGAAHTCVAYAPSGTDRDSVVCRGRSVAAPKEPLLPGVPVRELAAGGDHTCALLEDGTVRCWGKNDAGQLGDGTTNDAATPVVVPGLNGAIQVVTGLRHTCVLFQNGTVACWGANEHHQLANGTTETSLRPRVVVGLVGGKELGAAGDGTCARLEGGYVRCWGRNDRDQLGSGSREEHTVPVQVQFR